VTEEAKLFISTSLNLYSFNLLGLRQGWRTFLKARDQIADNFRRNTFACGNLNLLAPYSRFFQRRLSASFMLAPRAAALSSRPIFWPCLDSAVRISTPTKTFRLMVWVLNLIAICSNDKIFSYWLYCLLQEPQINNLYWGHLVQTVSKTSLAGLKLLFYPIMR